MEITCRTVQRRFLLKPSEVLNDRIVGIVGRAMTMYPVRIHLFVVLSNHMHLILSATDSETVSGFMRYINSNIAREAGRMHGWKDAFWSRRYKAIPILGDTALLQRMRYVLSHGCKEGLVAHPAQWPGVHCLHALTQGKPLAGHWIDRTAMYHARGLADSVDEKAFRTRYEVPLTPPPCWADRTAGELRALWRNLADEIAEQYAQARQTEGKKVLGARNVLALDPHAAPGKPNASRAPSCHAEDQQMRKWYRQAYRMFVDAYRHASGRLREQERPTWFPDNCYPPPPGFLPWAGGVSLS